MKLWPICLLYGCASAAPIEYGPTPRPMQPDPLSEAYEDFQAGRLDAAERRCKEVLERNADHAVANHLLGAVLFQQGKSEAALVHLRPATASPGGTAEMHNNLG